MGKAELFPCGGFGRPLLHKAERHGWSQEQDDARRDRDWRGKALPGFVNFRCM